MPDEVNFCGKCARPLKDNIPEITVNREQDIENPIVQTVHQENDKKQKTRFGLYSMIIGFVSMVLSCIAFGFLGIIGIVLGAMSVAKQEAKKGMAITGIVCSAIALFVSFCVIVAELDEDSSNQTYQAEQVAEEITETPVPTEQKATPTPKPTLSPEEIKKKIQKALLEENKEDLEGYPLKEVEKIAEHVLKTLSFQKNKDYDTANMVAKTMLSIQSDGTNTDSYKDITSNYNSYVKRKKKLSGDDFKGIEKKWEDVSEAISEIVSNTYYVYYDIETNSSDSKLDQIINAITGEMREYKHAYYAIGCSYDFTLEMWVTNDDDDEYVIYTHDAFPKAGKYSLDLIPTGDTVHIVNSSGFERDIDTYTVLSESDKEEYNRIEQLKIDYDNLCYDENMYKENIEYICVSFSK